MRTKIVATLGPTVGSLEKILALMNEGMDVARINFSHGTHEEHEQTIKWVKEARQGLNRPMAIMLDTKGPEIRVGELAGGVRKLERGQIVSLSGTVSDDGIIPVTPASVLNGLQKGKRVLFDDGYITSVVAEVLPDRVMVEVLNDGVLKSHKGINIPDHPLDLPMVTEQDLADIQFGCVHDVDLIAASFVCVPEHILEIKNIVAEAGRPNLKVLAKIETSRAIQNIDSIIQVADGVMVARGDLGVELPLSKVPGLQKMIIRKCYQEAKPCITATQMLESMIHNPRPTRAEASDVANAIFDSTSAVMLSGETASGAYPLESVKMMREIAHQAEQDFDYSLFLASRTEGNYQDIRAAIAIAAVKTAYNAHAQAIFVVTSTGRSAQLLSRLRPEMPIIALTFSEKVYHQLSVVWGIIPLINTEVGSTEKAVEAIGAWALERKLVHYGDSVVIVAGVPFGVAGTTNTMIVESIGDVLVRGHRGAGRTVAGEVIRLYSPQESDRATVKDKIVVTNRCDDSFLPLLKGAKGLILQNQPEDVASERYALMISKVLDLPVLVRAEFALSMLDDGLLVTVDPHRKVVYNGVLP